MEMLHAFDVSDFASSARNTLSTTSSIVFSPLTVQAVKGDLTGIASLTGLSGMAPHLMATQYIRRATANAQALALTGSRQAVPLQADELLVEDIPEPAARVSLFQGFKASYPHSKNGKRSKGHHRRRKNGFGEGNLQKLFQLLRGIALMFCGTSQCAMSYAHFFFSLVYWIIDLL
jgi:division protein 1